MARANGTYLLHQRAWKHDLGWIRTRPKYCQLIRVANREKRLAWCQEMIKNKETFVTVIWTDECSVQLDHHGRLCFRKVKQPRKLNPKPKHPPKVHVWAASHALGQARLLCLKESWCQHAIDQSWKQLCFHSSMQHSQTVIDSNRIMILNIQATTQRPSCTTTALTGGKLLQKGPI